MKIKTKILLTITQKLQLNTDKRKESFEICLERRDNLISNFSVYRYHKGPKPERLVDACLRFAINSWWVPRCYTLSAAVLLSGRWHPAEPLKDRLDSRRDTLQLDNQPGVVLVEVASLGCFQNRDALTLYYPAGCLRPSAAQWSLLKRPCYAKF